MLFYAAMHKAHSVHMHQYPEWFVFSDDDFYMRLELLEATLETPVTPHDKEYAVTGSYFMTAMHRVVNGTEVDTHRPQNGLWVKGQQCVSPCLFRVAVSIIISSRFPFLSTIFLLMLFESANSILIRLPISDLRLKVLSFFTSFLFPCPFFFSFFLYFFFFPVVGLGGLLHRRGQEIRS